MGNITLILGASLNETRYSNLAIKRLRDKKLEVVALGLKKGQVADVFIDDKKIAYKNIDTVSLYLSPKRQEAYYNYIVNLKPRRVIFNPGTENMEFVKLLKKYNIEIACTLVLLSTNQY